MTTNTPTEDDDLSVFDCTFEDFQKNISLLTKEVQTKVQEGCSNKDLDLTVKNGTKALTEMAFRVSDVQANSGYLLYMIERAVIECDTAIKNSHPTVLLPINQQLTNEGKFTMFNKVANHLRRLGIFTVFSVIPPAMYALVLVHGNPYALIGVAIFVVGYWTSSEPTRALRWRAAGEFTMGVSALMWIAIIAFVVGKGVL